MGAHIGALKRRDAYTRLGACMRMGTRKRLGAYARMLSIFPGRPPTPKGPRVHPRARRGMGEEPSGAAGWIASGAPREKRSAG